MGVGAAAAAVPMTVKAVKGAAAESSITFSRDNGSVAEARQDWKSERLPLGHI
jgi:hypothetical protein